MEKIIKNEMEDYIALHTYDYILAFCQATNNLPGDIQRIIWEKVNKYDTRDVECSGVPKKRKYGMGYKTERLNKLVRRWREMYGTP